MINFTSHELKNFAAGINYKIVNDSNFRVHIEFNTKQNETDFWNRAKEYCRLRDEKHQHYLEEKRDFELENSKHLRFKQRYFA